MKSFDEKLLQTLENPAEEVQKRYKALLSIKKSFKEHPDPVSYTLIVNEQCKNMFYLVTEKLAKFPTSAFGQIVKRTPSNELAELFELLEDIFLLVDKPGVLEIRCSFNTRVVILLFKFLDANTKREMRRSAFLFLLKVIESFEDFKTIDKEYIALFNYSLDSPALRENSEGPAYRLSCCLTANSPSNFLLKSAAEYCQQYMVFQDIGKLISDNPATWKQEDAVKEIFGLFTEHIDNNKNKSNSWLTFFEVTWMDVFFNEHGSEELASFSIFEEVKKKGLTKHLPIQKLFLNFIWHLIKDEVFIFSQQDLFFIMDILRSFYWSTNLKVEVNRILSLYHLFVLNRFKFQTPNDFSEDILRRIIVNLEELCIYNIFEESTSLGSPNPDAKDKEKNSENLFLKIFHDILRVHSHKYALEIFRTVHTAIAKGNNHIKEVSKDCLYPLVEILYTALGQMNSEDRSEYMATFLHYFESSDFVLRTMAFLIRKTENLILQIRNESTPEMLAYMEIEDASSHKYTMHSEYLFQFLLQKFCQIFKNKGRSKEHMFFDNDKTLYVHVKEQLWESQALVKTLSTIEERFNEWIMYLVILYEMDFLKGDPKFPLICKKFAEIINVLVDFDNIYNNGQTPERGKTSTKPIYPMPTETLYQIFSYFFSKTLTREKSNLEAKLWAVKGYLNIFINTKSEIPLNKGVIKDVVSFIYDTFKNNYFRDYDHDIFMTNCVIIRFTEKIFMTDYPGLKILISPYFKSIEQILFTENFSQLEKSSLDILGSLISDSETDKLNQLPANTIIKNSTLKILKSVLFMGYAHGDLKLVCLPETRMENRKPSMKLVREEIFCMVYKILDKMRKIKPKVVKTVNYSEYFDVEFQLNIYTLGILIIHLECNQGTKPNTAVLDISLEDFINVFLQQIDLNDNLMENEHMLNVRMINTLASLIQDPMRHYIKVLKQAVSMLTTSLINICKEEQSNQKKEVVSDLFFSLLRWLLGDQKGVIKKQPAILEDLNKLISTFASTQMYAEEFDIFFHTFFVNYMNFPLKNQSKDNTKSVFEETSFKNLDTNYLDYITCFQ